MRLTVIILLICVVVAGGCKKHKDEPIPDCVRTQVEWMKNHAICQSGNSVKEYKFQGAIVYVFSDGNCMSDGGASVLDEHCHSLGLLGGIAGNTKINGVEFSTAVYVRTIWSN